MPITLIISGGGKMGGALLSGLLRSAWADADEIAVIEPNADRRAELADAYPELGVFNAPEEGMLSGSGDRMTGAVLAVKPEAAEGACRVLGAVGVTRVLSIVAGIPCFRLEAALGGEPSVVRAMPNTPALVGAGVTVIAGGSHATTADLAWAEDLMSAVGTVVRQPERLFDPVTGLSGSGPAYFFLVAESLIEAGVQMGLCPRGQPTAGGRDHARVGPAAGRDRRGSRGPPGHGDVPRRHDGGRNSLPGVPGRALRLHGGRRRRHRAIPLPAAVGSSGGFIPLFLGPEWAYHPFWEAP